MQNLFHVRPKQEINGIKKFLWLFFMKTYKDRPSVCLISVGTGGSGGDCNNISHNNNNSKKKEMNTIMVSCWTLDVCQGASPCSNIQLWPWWNWARADRLSLTKGALKEIVFGDLSMIPSGLWKTKTYCHHFIVRLCFHRAGNILGGNERLLRRHNRPVLVFLQQLPGTVSSSVVRFMTEDFLE